MKSIAVIGLGQFGYQLAITLTQKGYDVLALDKEVEIVSEIKDLVHQAIILDTTDETAMRAANVDSTDLAVVAIGSNVQSSLLSTALLQRLNISEIFVRAINPLQESILRSMEIDRILNIEKEMGIQVSNAISSDVGRYIEISDRHSLMEIKVPKGLVGKTLKMLNLRKKHKINVVGIKTAVAHVDDDGDIHYSLKMSDVPDPNYPLGKDDMLVMAGTDERLNRFIKTENQD